MIRNLPIRDGFALFLRQWPSNWESSPMNINGCEYNCVEQWMMAEKARTFGDLERRREIMIASHPREHKDLGRNVRGYDDSAWSAIRYSIVLRGIIEKYRQNDHLRGLLFAVPDGVVFVEASPYDRIWGIGLSASHPDATKPDRWLGQNLLGKAINEARHVLSSW